MENNENIKVGFFGTPELATITLDTLERHGYSILFVVTQPDRPSGRKMHITHSPVKVWALERNIPVLQPENLSDPDFIENLRRYNCDVFIVMAYGKIIPEEILNIPRAKCLNIHPSLLPKYRGSCPLESAILANDMETGATIIQMDKEMDHGPIVWIKEWPMYIWPPTTKELGEELVDIASDALALLLPSWIAGLIPAIPQDEIGEVTYTKKIRKEDGLIDLNDDPYKNLLKFKAYQEWPSVYFFKDGKRIKITEASFRDGKFIIERVIPEGKKEINYLDL